MCYRSVAAGHHRSFLLTSVSSPFAIFPRLQPSAQGRAAPKVALSWCMVPYASGCRRAHSSTAHTQGRTSSFHTCMLLLPFFVRALALQTRVLYAGIATVDWTGCRRGPAMYRASRPIKQARGRAGRSRPLGPACLLLTTTFPSTELNSTVTGKVPAAEHDPNIHTFFIHSSSHMLYRASKQAGG